MGASERELGVREMGARGKDMGARGREMVPMWMGAGEMKARGGGWEQGGGNKGRGRWEQEREVGARDRCVHGGGSIGGGQWEQRWREQGG
jgi:hypothetical protein